MMARERKRPAKLTDYLYYRYGDDSYARFVLSVMVDELTYGKGWLQYVENELHCIHNRVKHKVVGVEHVGVETENENILVKLDNGEAVSHVGLEWIIPAELA